eukprot:9338776-Pyramimonas_sp.AAC.1
MAQGLPSAHPRGLLARKPAARACPKAHPRGSPWACPGLAPTASQACPGDLRATPPRIHAPRHEHA